MGGQPWWYLVPYEKDVAKSLEALRQREFKAGRYNPAEPFPRFPVDLSHAPGCKHPSIDDAREDADADGTRSILDVSRISAKPDYDAVAPLDEDELMEFFGTASRRQRTLKAATRSSMKSNAARAYTSSFMRMTGPRRSSLPATPTTEVGGAPGL